MIYLVAALVLIGASISGWAWWAGRGPYDADGHMWLVAPMLFGLALIALGIVIAMGWGAWHLFRHIVYR